MIIETHYESAQIHTHASSVDPCLFVLFSVDYEPPSSTSLPFSLSAATTKLREFVQSHPDQTATTLSILLRLIDGVLRNPTDPAKRRIRLANETFRTRVFQFDQAMEFLKAVRIKHVLSSHMRSNILRHVKYGMTFQN